MRGLSNAGMRQAGDGESKPTGGKVTIRRDLIERGGSSEAWYEGETMPQARSSRPRSASTGGRLARHAHISSSALSHPRPTMRFDSERGSV